LVFFSLRLRYELIEWDLCSSCFSRAFRLNEALDGFDVLVRAGLLNYYLRTPRPEYAGHMETIDKKLSILFRVLEYLEKAKENTTLSKFKGDHPDDMKAMKEDWAWFEKAVRGAFVFYLIIN